MVALPNFYHCFIDKIPETYMGARCGSMGARTGHLKRKVPKLCGSWKFRVVGFQEKRVIPSS